MPWGAAVAEGIALLSTFSTSLSCPAHCYPSSLIPWISGIALGLVFGLLTGLWLAWHLFSFASSSRVPPEFTSPDPPLRRRTSRLQGYLYE